MTKEPHLRFNFRQHSNNKNITIKILFTQSILLVSLGFFESFFYLIESIYIRLFWVLNNEDVIKEKGTAIDLDTVELIPVKLRRTQCIQF